ncbi:MAG: hypothetical protein KGZ30_04600 [Anaplasmataceae bacterium]|nr:hypothetical protein [Anaplasmataceae bacterium]MBS3903620.1 hypothetical protein [Anaplasmataceae bacterium]
MTHQEHKNCARHGVMQIIEEGKIAMKPRWHFVLKTSLVILGGILITLALLYLTSFIIFILWYTGAWFVPIYGVKGLISFLLAAPWLLVALVVVFLWILEILFRHYSFAYRRPLLYSTLSVLGLVLVGGFTVAQTSLHENLLEQARRDRLPVAGPLYRSFGLGNISDIHRGVIDQMIDDGFIISNRRNESVEVQLTPQTRFPFGTDFETGDFVVIFGERNNGQVTALGVQKVGDGERIILATSSEQMRFHFIPHRRNGR